MESIRWFFANMTTGPFRHLLEVISLPPDGIWRSGCLLGAFMVVCELIRISLGTVLTRSVLAHVIRCLLTFALQAIVLAVVLIYAAHQHPDRAWINLGFALLMYFIWYLAGQLTSLARPDNEGADLGFMTVGALITFPAGIIAALLA